MKKSMVVDNILTQMPIAQQIFAYKSKQMPYRLSTLSLAICLIGLSMSTNVFAETENVDFQTLVEEDSQPTTEDITASDKISHIALPTIRPNSARSKGVLSPNPKQQTSLEKLKSFYQPNPEKPQNDIQNIVQPQHPLQQTPSCQGTWIYPVNQQKSININPDTANSQYPVYAEADYGYYDNQNYAELTGNVKVQQGNQQISADKVVINVEDGITAAQGSVMLVDSGNATTPNSSNALKNAKSGGLITISDEVAYQVDSGKATAKDVAFASIPLQAHGYAKQLNKVDESQYNIHEVMFTTCSPEKPMWQITAKSIDVDTDTGRGEARNATLKIKNTPVLYLPYFNFPIDDRRTSGFLLPRAGFSNDGGFTTQTPYYFNLAPNYDATVTPTIYTNRNPMLTGEFRYLTEKYGQGDLTVSYLPKDKQYEHNDRSSLQFHHHWQSDKYPTLSAQAVYQYMSDSAYANDFETLGTGIHQLNLPRRIQANYYADNITALAKFETFQTLGNNQEVLDKDKPYYRLPQISVRYRVPNDKLYLIDNQVEITGISDFAYFKRPINDGSAPERSGGRLFNKMTATYPFNRSWGYIKPSISLQHLYTQYDEETVLAQNIQREDKTKSIFVPEYSLDTGLHFIKNGSPFGKFDQSLGGYQLISPRLKYVYAPYKNQTDVPNFNTRYASLNYPQLFENSWFLGYDRLPDNNHLTTAVNYRYIDNQGLTRFDASIGQQWFFDDVRVHLENHNEPISVKNSGTVLQISSQPSQDFWVDMDGSITDTGKLGYINTQFRYVPNERSLYNVGFVKRNESGLGQKPLSAITGSVIFPITSQWQFLGAVQYDNLKNRYSDILAGLTYDSCCYGFSVYGRRYYDELNDNAKPVNAIMAEISLSGIANKRDGKLSSLIADRVLGYRRD